MSSVVTDAIVLHAFDYLETSRILRILTRDAGLLSVLAKGARRNRSKYGSAVDLFAEGEAHVYLKPARDLNTLAAFDVLNAHLSITQTFDCFAAASAIAELVLRVGRDDSNPALYQAVSDTFHRLSTSPPDASASEALAGAWRIVVTLGFTPTIDVCANCHTPIDATLPVAFAHTPGGALCPRCAPFAANRRILPPDASATLRAWLIDVPSIVTDPAALRAHQRLLREFLQEHLTGDRPLRAFTAWESADTGHPISVPEILS